MASSKLFPAFLKFKMALDVIDTVPFINNCFKNWHCLDPKNQLSPTRCRNRRDVKTINIEKLRFSYIRWLLYPSPQLKYLIWFRQSIGYKQCLWNKVIDNKLYCKDAQLNNIQFVWLSGCLTEYNIRNSCKFMSCLFSSKFK